MIVGQTGTCIHCGTRVTVAAKLDNRRNVIGSRVEALTPSERFATHCQGNPGGHQMASD